MWNGGSHRELALELHGVAARFAQDPAADRDDQAGLLGERDEVERRHEPAVRVDPADERLDAGDPPESSSITGW